MERIYGKIVDGSLITSDRILRDYKPIKYNRKAIPSDYYEETHYLIEDEPIEHEDYIQVNIIAVEKEIEVPEDSELTLEEIKAGIEERKAKHFAEKNKKEVSEIDVLKARVKASNDYVDFLEGVIVEMAQVVCE